MSPIWYVKFSVGSEFVWKVCAPLITFNGTVSNSDCMVLIGRKILIKEINWDVYIKYLSSKLNKSYYVMQSLEGTTVVNILRSMYFANFH
jgi:hypothetical protein